MKDYAKKMMDEVKRKETEARLARIRALFPESWWEVQNDGMEKAFLFGQKRKDRGVNPGP